MKVLVIGSGGREYSIGMALKRDSSIKKIYFALGNGATSDLGENVDLPTIMNWQIFVKRVE